MASELCERLRTFVSDHAGAPLGRGALRHLSPLNRLLGQDEAYRQIELAPLGESRHGGDDHIEHRARNRVGAGKNPEALLIPVAEEARVLAVLSRRLLTPQFVAAQDEAPSRASLSGLLALSVRCLFGAISTHSHPAPAPAVTVGGIEKYH